jgi:hypothetical protein
VELDLHQEWPEVVELPEEAPKPLDLLQTLKAKMAKKVVKKMMKMMKMRMIVMKWVIVMKIWMIVMMKRQ